MNKTTKVFSFAITMFALVGLVTFPSTASAEEPSCDPYYEYCPPPPPPKDKEGCTPGFWKANEKKHDGRDWPTSAWKGSPMDGGFDTAVTTWSSLSEVGIDSHLVDPETHLIDALKFKGGSGDEGAERIYLRAAVAAFLNANHPDVNYQIFPPGILPALNGAHGTAVTANGGESFRDIILAFAGMLDAFNNGPEWIEEDFCPLNNSGKPTR